MPSTQTLPTEFTAGRIFLRPTTSEGHTLRLLADTGGGVFLLASTVERLHLPVETVGTYGDAKVVTTLPAFRPDASIPGVSIDDDRRHPEYRGRFLVVADENAPLGDIDGVLGAPWFGGRVWSFDYPNKRLVLRASADRLVFDPAHTVSLGFQTDKRGRRSTHLPSIEATVEGETCAYLLDTGATVKLTDAAIAELADGGPAEHATSFVAAAMFDAWREHHPEWRVVEGADLNAGGQPMIEVPSVTIARHEVGPVWFTRRPDANFHEWMTSMMDRRVEGAIGGSLLQHFSVAFDYPRARASFRVER